MIYTLTLNPAVDRTLETVSLEFDRVLRARAVHDAAGGKGVNVMRVARALGATAEAIVPVGGLLGAYFCELTPPHWSLHPIPIRGRTRMNTEIVDADGGTSVKVNEPGPTLNAGEVAQIVRALEDCIDAPGWLAICGSLPPGLDDAVLEEFAGLARARGLRVALDIPGISPAALRATEPDLYKANRIELNELLSRTPDRPSRALEAVSQMVGSGVIGAALVGLGREGALLVTDDGAVRLGVESPVERKPVGAGDALLAGYLAGCDRGASSMAAFALGVAAGTNSAQKGMDVLPAAVEQLARELAESIEPVHEREAGAQWSL